MLAVRATFAGAPPLFLNDMGELGEPRGGRGPVTAPVNELVMVTICCNGLPTPAELVLQFLGENGISGGGGRFEPDAD